MTNFELWTRLNILVRKNKEGNSLSPDEFNELLDWANTELQNMTFPYYEVNQDVKEALLTFVIDETVTQSGNFINLTDDLSESYSKLIGNPYYNDGSREREIDIVTDSEWVKRTTSALKYPSASRPICRLSTDGAGDKLLKILPITDEDIKLTYLRDAIRPSLTLALDANDLYVQTASVEMEWGEEEKLKALYLIAQKIGIRLNENDVIQYSMTKEKE